MRKGLQLLFWNYFHKGQLCIFATGLQCYGDFGYFRILRATNPKCVSESSLPQKRDKDGFLRRAVPQRCAQRFNAGLSCRGLCER